MSTDADVRDVTETKQCNRCMVTKPLTDFYKAAKTRDGLTPMCAQCSNMASKKYSHRKKTGEDIDLGNRVAAFQAGILAPEELTFAELTGGYIQMPGTGNIRVPTFRLNKQAQNKFNKELSNRLNALVREKASRAIEVIAEIAESDLVEPADRLKAATWLAERVIGKTPDIILTGEVQAPHEAIFESMLGGSRNEYRAALGQAIDAEVVDIEDEPSAKNFETMGNNHKLDDSQGMDHSEDATDPDTGIEFSDIGHQDNGSLGETTKTTEQNINVAGNDGSTEQIVDEIVSKKEDAKALKKRISELKRRRFAARAVGAKSLVSAPWLIDWRIDAAGHVRACLVPPVAQTPAKLAIIAANDEATNDENFIRMQQANRLAAKEEKKAAKLEAKAKQIQENING
jgi:hypothetical protein